MNIAKLKFLIPPYELRLRTTLVVPFVLQIVTAVGLVSYLSYRNGQQAVNDLASQLRREVSVRVYERAQAYLKAPPLVNQINEDAVRLGILDFEDLRKARPYLWKQALQFDSIGHVGLANNQGQYLRVGWVNRLVDGELPQLAEQLNLGTGDLVYYTLDKQGNPTTIAKISPNYNVQKRPFYKVALEKKQAAWSEVYINFGYGSLQLNASQPYYDAQGNLIGVLTCQMGLDQIRAFLQTLKVGRSGQVFIIEPSGELIASSLKDQPLSVGKGKQQKRFNAQDSSNLLMSQSVVYLRNRFQRLEDIHQPIRLDFQLKGERQFLEVSPLKDKYGLNWLIVVVVPESDFMDQIHKNTRLTLWLCFAALIVATGICMLTARWIALPILRVSQASKEMASGDLDQRIVSSQIRELETLANSFNRMAGQLKESFETLEDKVQERTAELATANEEIAALNQRLQADNLRMSSKLDILREMQQLILPRQAELAVIQGLDIAGFMEPADEVGGDYYDVLQTDDIVTIGIGDVTGHGLESGILMVMVQTAVRTLQESQESDPVRFLDILNRTIYKNVERMNSEKNLTLAVLNYAGGKVSIFGQHEEVIVIRVGGEIERINTLDLGFPIGLDEEIAEFIHPICIKLNSGEGFVLYTDGITEAKDIHRKQYGLKRLCEVISQNWKNSAEGVKEAVITDLRRHIGEQKVFDDITLLVVKQK